MIDSNSTTPTQLSQSSAQTVLEMDCSSNRNSRIIDSSDDLRNYESFSKNINEVFETGIQWPLAEASTSSAPATCYREGIEPKNLNRIMLERRLLLKDKLSKLSPKTRRKSKADSRSRLDAEALLDEKKISDKLRKSRNMRVLKRCTESRQSTE
ncbi:unnamed protein product [Auanema sp. JU1783]|nr:unnamed protein product [Auanema sp. JU1783]